MNAQAGFEDTLPSRPVAWLVRLVARQPAARDRGLGAAVAGSSPLAGVAAVRLRRLSACEIDSFRASEVVALAVVLGNPPGDHRSAEHDARRRRVKDLMQPAETRAHRPTGGLIRQPLRSYERGWIDDEPTS